MDEMNEIRFQKIEESKSGDELMTEEWVLSSDTRHGKDGYRASRYLPDKEDPFLLNWDESHMFFSSLDEAYRAFETGELDAGRKAF